jgi:hypothetical protein
MAWKLPRAPPPRGFAKGECKQKARPRGAVHVVSKDLSTLLLKSLKSHQESRQF